MPGDAPGKLLVELSKRVANGAPWPHLTQQPGPSILCQFILGHTLGIFMLGPLWKVYIGSLDD